MPQMHQRYIWIEHEVELPQSRVRPSLLVFGMIMVHFYRGLILAPRIVSTVSESGKATLQKFSLKLVKINFIAGIMVLLLSGMV